MRQPDHIGSYRIERLLGVGSFAVVWLGFDPILGARVAIKVLAENWSHDLRVRERFLDEGRLLWRLDHERVVRVHAVGELDDGRPYLVMAWAEGGSLRDRLADGPLRVGTSLAALRQIAAGAGVLHDNGIVHRDLTPGNVLFRRPSGGPARAGFPTDEVVIADLGLAKALATASGLTARAGTPGFMAPEQDDPLAVVDARTDVFGLGRLGVTLLCVAAAGRAGTTPPLRDGVPPNVAGVLRKATAHRAADRHADAAAFAVALERAVTPGRVSRRTLVGALAVAATVLLTTTAAAPLRGRSADGRAIAVDSTGRITVTLPPGWRAYGAGWEGRRGPAGELRSATIVSPRPKRWHTDSNVPGAFVGLPGTPATPVDFVAGRGHRGCVASPPRTSGPAAMEWVVVEFSSCRSGRPTIVEAAALGPGGTGLVYAQIVPPPGGGPRFVDELLAGIRVRR